jgi:hypothetical protein
MTEKLNMPIKSLKGIRASTFSPHPEQSRRVQEEAHPHPESRTDSSPGSFRPMVFDTATGSWTSSPAERFHGLSAESKKT